MRYNPKTDILIRKYEENEIINCYKIINNCDSHLLSYFTHLYSDIHLIETSVEYKIDKWVRPKIELYLKSAYLMVFSGLDDAVEFLNIDNPIIEGLEIYSALAIGVKTPIYTKNPWFAEVPVTIEEYLQNLKGFRVLDVPKDLLIVPNGTLVAKKVMLKEKLFEFN